MSKKVTYCSLDIESTGLDENKDHIIEVGAVLFEIAENGEIKFGKEFSELVKPPIAIPVFIQNLTNIRESDVESAPAWDEVLPRFKKFVGSHTIVGQNVHFDIKFIASHGLEINNPVLDTQTLARVFAPDSKQFNLDYLHTHFGLQIESHHRALADSKSAAIILGKIINSFWELPQNTQKQITTLLKESSLVFKTLFIAGKTPNLPASKSKNIKVEVGKTIEAEKIQKKRKQSSLFEKLEKTGRLNKQPDAKAEDLEIIRLLKDKGLNYFAVPIGLMNSRTVALFAKKFSKIESGVLFSVSNSEELNVLEQNGEWTVLSDPNAYLCEESFKNWLDEKNLPDDLTQFLIKVLVWQVRGGKTFSELSSTSVEYLYRTLIAGDVKACSGHTKNRQCGFGKILFQLSSGNKVALMHQSLWEYSSVITKKSISKLLVWDLGSMLSLLENSKTEFVTLKKVRSILQILSDVESKKGILSKNDDLFKKTGKLLNKIDLDFGLLGIELSAEPFAIGQRTIDEEMRENYSFTKIESVFRKLAERILEIVREAQKSVEPATPAAKTISLLAAFANFFLEFFDAPKKEYIYWFDTFGNEIKLGRRPCQLDFKKIVPHTDSVFFSPFTSPEAVSYIQDSLGLEKQEVPAPNLILSQIDLLVPELDSRISDETVLKKILERKQYRTLVLFNSQKALDAAYAILEKKNLPPHLLVQRHTGHHWKNAESFDKQDNAVWFLTVHNYLKLVKNLPEIRLLILPKIPYAVSDAGAASYDQDEVFSKFVIPRTVLRLERMLSRFVKAMPGQTRQMVVLLDQRIEQDYNNPIYLGLLAALSGEVKHFDGIEALESFID